MPASPAFVPLPGSRRELLPNSRPAGSIDASENASITVRTRGATDPADLERRVRDLYAQPLAERTYFTPDALAQEYGGIAADLDAVEHYAQRHNLVVSHRNTAQRTLILSGRLSDLLDAFHADLHMFHHASGTYRGRRGEILIPRQLAGIITAIVGFDTRPKHRSPFRHRNARTATDSRATESDQASASIDGVDNADAANAATAEPDAGQNAALAGPGGDNGVPATTFAQRYHFPTTQAGTTLDGTGQCIAIIELGGGFDSTDLDYYFKEINVPRPNVVAVGVDQGGNHPTKTGGADGEVMLDIEVAGAVAPGARIAVYFAPNTNKGFLDAISAAVHDTERKPSVISISWGGPEAQGDAQAIQAFHEVFVQAAAMGLTVCAASGDHGTADLDGFHWDNKLHVDHPAVDDMVLGCGGTQINAKNVDVVWNDGTPFSQEYGGGGWASGGGISTVFAVPDYQRAANTVNSLDTGKPGRGVPDIAMSATNYFVRVQHVDQPSGGTSAVAPLMASLVALLNQAKGKNVGFLNPFLYANAAKGVTKDVTSGTNAITKTAKGYKAGKGWDPCTGLGTPDGTAILGLL